MTITGIHDEIDEKRLVFLLKTGDEDAYRILFRRFRNPIYAVAYGITLDREESADIVQEVLIKVFENIKNFREESRLDTWIRRISVNESLNWKRKLKRRFRWHHKPLDENEEETGFEGGQPDTLYEKRMQEKILDEKLKTLPEEARTVLVLKEMEGLSYDEIAKILNIRVGTVSSRLYYARRKLAGSLKEYNDGKDQR